MSDLDLYIRFGIALAIGTLIGLEREHASTPEVPIFAGVRTFALIALVGATAGLVATAAATPWVFVGAMAAMGLLLAIAYFALATRNDIGLTTEVTALLTFLLGALCYWGYGGIASTVGVVTVVLLSLKGEMHRFARRITREDIYATLKFAVISAVVLPLLPDRSFGPAPFDVFNPYRIWIMVVLISGISFLGYILMQVLPGRNGIGLTGLLGGLASSTAVTVSFAGRSKERPELSKPLAFGMVLAWTVMFLRMPLEISVVDPALVPLIWQPTLAAGGIAVLYAIWFYRRREHQTDSDVVLSNPFKLTPALQFALAYVVILFFSRAASLYLGNSGVLLTAVVAGSVDVTAVVLTVAELHRLGDISGSTAAQALVIGGIANTVAKAAIAIALGDPHLWKSALPVVPLMLAAAGAVLWFMR